MENLSKVKTILIVLSGKGGVGKSSITTQLALSLAQSSQIAVLDVDLCGPSLPRMFGVSEGQVLQSSQGWVPIHVPGTSGKLKIMSLGFLLNQQDDAVVWRGPKKTAMIHQFMNDVAWGECDFLIIDTPPGTSDEHLALVESLKSYSRKAAILVTTPQLVAIEDVRKEIDFCEKVKLPMVGVIENMSGFKCPNCADCTPIFSSGGGMKLAQSCGIAFLGSLPIDPKLAKFLDAAPMDQDGNADLVMRYASTDMATSFKPICDHIYSHLSELFL